MRNVRKWFQFCLPAAFLALAGCALNDQISGQVDRLERNVDEVRNASILKNIARASEDKPLDFTTVPTLHGTNSLTSTLGLPDVIFGPHQAGLTRLQRLVVFGGGTTNGSGTGNAISSTGTTNFDMTTLESKDFYRGLLNPVSPATFALFQAQGVPREILFYLFVDRIVIKKNGTDTEYRNDPRADNFSMFRYYINLAVDYGLSFEVYHPKEQGVKNRSCSNNDSINKDCNSENKSDPPTRICFDPALRNVNKVPEIVLRRNVKPICGSPEPAGGGRQSATINIEHGSYKIDGKARSIFEVFQYLGRIVALGERGRIELTSDDAKSWGAGTQEDDILFRVERGNDVTGSCYVSVWEDGGTFCIPEKGAPNTTRIVQILVQLIALSTSIADVPFTPTVHISE